MNIPRDPNSHRFQWLDWLVTFLKIVNLVLEAIRLLKDLFK